MPGLPAAPALHVAATGRVHSKATAGCGPRREQTHRPARAPACAAPRQRPRRRPPARPRPSGAVETDLAVRVPAPARQGGLGTRAHRGAASAPSGRERARARSRRRRLGRAPGHVGARPNGSAPVHVVALVRAGLGDPLRTDLVDSLYPITRHPKPETLWSSCSPLFSHRSRKAKSLDQRRVDWLMGQKAIAIGNEDLWSTLTPLVLSGFWGKGAS